MTDEGGRRLFVWSIDPLAGFESAWATLTEDTLTADGHSAGLRPEPFSVDYRLETRHDFITSRMVVTARRAAGEARLDLLRGADGGWTVNGEPRPDLDDALDCDLEACPLTNTMPIVRHRLHESGDQKDQTLVMAFIEVPSLRVSASTQRYTYLRATDAGALIRFSSGSFQSELTIDRSGFVVDYPLLGRRVEAGARG